MPSFGDRGDEPYRERNKITMDGSLTVAGLVLARTRWKREVHMLEEMISETEKELQFAEERREADWYAMRMADAIRKGSEEATVNALISIHAPNLASKNGGVRGQGGGIASVKRINAVGEAVLLFEPRSVREAVRAQGEAFASERAYSIHGSRLLLGLGGAIPAAPTIVEEPETWIERILSDRQVRRAVQGMRSSGQAAGADG